MALLATATGVFAYADEDRDWGLAPTREIRQPPYSAPTPLTVPGAQTISTDELRKLIEDAPETLLIDVAGGAEDHLTLKGAVWMPLAGQGLHFFDPVQADTSQRLAALTGGDRLRSMVFFCVDVLCWRSYNASLRAVALGYGSVYWYRGGFFSWREAGYPVESLQPTRTLPEAKP